MRRTMLVIMTLLLVLPVFPLTGTNNIAPVRADGTIGITKAVDIDGNLDFADDGRTVLIGGTLRYRVNWSFTPGTQDVINPYVADTLPAGTTYINPSANPTANMQYSLNGGVTWINGEPPNGSPAGTMIRWTLPSMYVGWTGANGSAWNMVQGLPQPSDIDVSRTNTGSPANISEVWYDMKLDASGYPCIVWQDSSDPRDSSTAPRAGLPVANTHMYFVRWNGSNWVCQDGSVYNPTAAFPNTAAQVPVPNNVWTPSHPRLALDNGGDPHIVYDAWRPSSGGNYDIHFVHWDPVGIKWINNTGGSPTSQAFVYAQSTNSYYPQIQMNTTDDAIISWFEETSSGSNQYSIFTCRIPGSLGGETDLLGGNNIAGYPITRTNGSRLGRTFSMTLDTNYRPCIAFENNNPAEVHFVRWNGTSWRDIWNNIYTTGSAGSNVTNTAAGDSSTPWLCIDPSTNNPKITWNEIRLPGPTNTICYLGWSTANSRWELATGVAYSSATLNAALVSGSLPSMDLERNNRPCIAFNGGYMRWNGASWINGGNNSIAINTTDGTGSLNPYTATFNPIDVRTIAGVDKIGISTSLQGNPTSIYDVAYIQSTIPAAINGTYYFNVAASSVMPQICNTSSFNHQHVVGGALTTVNSNTVCNPMTEISISKTATKPNYLRTEDIGFDIFVNNPTGGVINNVVVTDTIPANLVYKNSTIVPTTVTATTITYNFGNLAANSTISFHINFTVNPGYNFNNIPLNVTNVAVVTSTQFTPRTGTASARIDEIGMSFTKTSDKLKYKPNDKVIYTITVTNLGTLPYTNVSIDDPIPTDLSFVSISPTAGNIVDNVYKIFIGTLNPGATLTYTFTYTIKNSSIKNGERNGLTSFSVLNTATLKMDNYENMIAQARITILIPKLSVTKLASKYSMTPEDTITFTLIAKNISEVETTNTTLTDVFPNELVYVSSEPTGVSKLGKLEYDLGTFNPGETQTYTITFSVKHQETWPDNGIVIINSAILSCTELDDVIDTAMIAISPRRVAGPLDLVCKWGNLDAKTNILNGKDLALELYATGGGSPYDFSIDWGDGSPKSLKTSVPESDTVKADHTFTAGEYTVTIKCVDRGARTKIVTRKITIK